MKTNLNKLFLDKKHKERFDDIVIVNEDFATYCGCASALYLLSANSEISQKVKPYVTEDSIEWDDIVNNVDLTTGQETVIKFAADLYSGYIHLAERPISLIDLNYCDDKLIKATLIAILIRLDWYSRDHSASIDDVLKSLGFVKEV